MAATTFFPPSHSETLSYSVSSSHEDTTKKTDGANKGVFCGRVVRVVVDFCCYIANVVFHFCSYPFRFIYERACCYQTFLDKGGLTDKDLSRLNSLFSPSDKKTVKFREDFDKYMILWFSEAMNCHLKHSLTTPLYAEQLMQQYLLDYGRITRYVEGVDVSHTCSNQGVASDDRQEAEQAIEQLIERVCCGREVTEKGRQHLVVVLTALLSQNSANTLDFIYNLAVNAVIRSAKSGGLCWKKLARSIRYADFLDLGHKMKKPSSWCLKVREKGIPAPLKNIPFTLSLRQDSGLSPKQVFFAVEFDAAGDISFKLTYKIRNSCLPVIEKTDVIYEAQNYSIQMDVCVKLDVDAILTRDDATKFIKKRPEILIRREPLSIHRV